MVVVADSGPIIHLSQVGLLELLPSLFKRVLVPSKVYQEVVIDGAGLPGALELKAAIWVQVTETTINPKYSILLHSLDAGEVAAISLASNTPESRLLIDDQAGRHIAQQLKIPVVGTLGILLAAKRKGLVGEIAPVLAQLQKCDFWLSKGIVQRVLEEAGEVA